MADTKLAPDEITRYARHLVLPEIGGAGQQKLKAARVLIVGAGGLGSPVAQYLAACGVGTIGLVDDDHVSLSNLQRQILHGTADVGRAKVASAADALAKLNPHVTVPSYQTRLTQDNAQEILSGYDVIADGCDNFPTRFLVAKWCAHLETPLVSGAVNRFDGSLTTLMPYAQDDVGNPYPRYEDLVPEVPQDMLTCEETGIMGPITGVIGTLQALEVVKLITGAGALLVGRQLLFDGLAGSFYTVRYGRRT